MGDLKIAPYINLPLSGEVPRRGRGGTEAAFGTVSNNGALARRGELRSPANVAIGTVLPGKAYGMKRGGRMNKQHVACWD